LASRSAFTHNHTPCSSAGRHVRMKWWCAESAAKGNARITSVSHITAIHLLCKTSPFAVARYTRPVPIGATKAVSESENPARTLAIHTYRCDAAQTNRIKGIKFCEILLCVARLQPHRYAHRKPHIISGLGPGIIHGVRISRIANELE
jgi:hypothetical protein